MMRVVLQVNVPGQGVRGDELVVDNNTGNLWVSQGIAGVLDHHAKAPVPQDVRKPETPHEARRRRRKPREETDDDDDQ
jgi:hypothetical protein